jgi:outer membrane lipoprotein carrier protein
LGYHPDDVELSAGLAALAVAFLASAPFAAPDAALSAEGVARRVEERTNRAADLTARFRQTYRSGALGRAVVESGTLKVKRPGRMLWEYKEPEKKTFLSDGKKFYFYVPADRQVIVRDQDPSRSLPALLLSGRGNILAEFDVSLEDAPAGQSRLRLVPKAKDPDVERVLLEVDDSFRIRAIEVEDVQGSRSRFEFEDLRENVGLPDGLFRFEIPRGVEVVGG